MLLQHCRGGTNLVGPEQQQDQLQQLTTQKAHTLPRETSRAWDTPLAILTAKPRGRLDRVTGQPTHHHSAQHQPAPTHSSTPWAASSRKPPLLPPRARARARARAARRRAHRRESPRRWCSRRGTRRTRGSSGACTSSAWRARGGTTRWRSGRRGCWVGRRCFTGL